MRKNTRLQNNRAMRVIVASMVSLFSFAALADPSAKEIMQKAGDARKLTGSEAVMKLSIFGKNKGDVRERKIALATKTVGTTEKRIYSFLAPADVKGTGVLTFDHDKKDDDTWVYLPKLRGEPRRIVSSAKGKKFLGSEFSYADLNTPILDNYKIKLLKTEKAGGTDCYVIEMLPASEKVAEEEGYSKKIVWVGKSDFMIRKSEFYDPDKALLKVLTMKNIKLVDKKLKRYRAMYSEMVNKQDGRKSIFVTERIENSPNVKDDLFTTAYLKRQ